MHTVQCPYTFSSPPDQSSAPGPRWGLCPWTTLGALPQTPVIGSRSPYVSTPHFLTWRRPWSCYYKLKELIRIIDYLHTSNLVKFLTQHNLLIAPDFFDTHIAILDRHLIHTDFSGPLALLPRCSFQIHESRVASGPIVYKSGQGRSWVNRDHASFLYKARFFHCCEYKHT